jgi:5-methylcytosine-specific restriction endonuclease McrA
VVPLELDHVNGDRADNRLENLRLVCPNCHAQTDTYRGRNIGRGGADRARDRRGEPEVAAAQARAADAHRRLERVFSCPA